MYLTMFHKVPEVSDVWDKGKPQGHTGMKVNNPVNIFQSVDYFVKL